MMSRHIYLLFFLLFGLIAHTQQLPLEKEISKLYSIDNDELVEEVLLLYDSLTRMNDHNLKVKIVKRVFKITSERNELPHSISIAAKVRFGLSDDYELFDKAYMIAKSYDNKRLMIYFDEWQSRYLLEKGIYDKAMTCLLRLREVTKGYSDPESYRNALNLLGDIYYGAKLMDLAKEIYEEMLQYYIDNNDWNYWRPYMLMNNLGEIAIFNNDTNVAFLWFSKSLVIADTSLFQPYRNNTLSYTKLKLAEIHLMKGEFDKTEDLIREVEEYGLESLFEDVKQELYYQKAMYYLKVGKFNESLEISASLVPSRSSLYSEYRFVPEVYRLLSDIYQGKHQYRKSLYFLNKYTHISDSIEKQGNIARSIIMLANKNHQLEKDELELEKQKLLILNESKRSKQNVILVSLLIGVILLIIIVLVVLRNSLLRKAANRKLSFQKQKIQEYANELNVANNTKDRFFSIIAHDLKGPTGMLNNLIKLLADQYNEIEDKERLEILQSAARSSDNTYRLLLNLLEWARSQQGKVEYKPIEFNLNESISNVYSILKDTADHKNQRIEIRVPDKLVIVNDISMFETIMRNLISNALKFTTEGGEVLVEAITEKGRVHISVIDNGIGIPEETLTKLFDMTARNQRRGTNNETGTGLGLLLCKEFVDKMGGELKVTSRVGEGSKFEIVL